MKVSPSRHVPKPILGHRLNRARTANGTGVLGGVIRGDGATIPIT